MFNRAITKALNNDDSSKSLNEVRDKLIALLNQLASVVTQALSPHQYQTVVALIITLVHARDIAKDLIDGKVQSTDDFAWTRCFLSIKTFTIKLLEIKLLQINWTIIILHGTFIFN